MNVTVLEDLHCLSQEQGNNIQTVYIDDCCRLGSKIQSIFGTSVAVKLDLFHAIQRLSKTLPKRHALYHQCLMDLRQVFRQNGDSGERRMADTPLSEEITKKKKEFCEKWEQMTDSSGKRIWTSASAVAVTNLQKHVSAGCLSHIPPSCGTNRNERFHRYINSFFNKSKIGVLLAYALMTVLIHVHNSQVMLNGRRIITPITLGLCSDVSLCDSQRPMGIVRKSCRREQEDDHWETDLSDREIDMLRVVSVFSSCVTKFNIIEGLKKMDLKQMIQHVYRLQSFTTNTEIPDYEISVQHTTSIEKHLSNCGLVISPSPKDGDCFFHSVARDIIHAPDIWKCVLKDAGVIHCISEEIPGNLSLRLRQLFVSEITGERQQYYMDFIVGGVDYCSEARKFLQIGYFNSQLGNLMPVAMATVLQCYIVLFKTDGNNHLYVTPQVAPPMEAQERTIFVVYNPEGAGHYDAALTFNCPELKTPTTKCNCGVNKPHSKSCVPRDNFSSRCVCLKSGKGCTALCRCKNCENPNGVRKSKVQNEKRGRKRRAHPYQMAIPASKEFASDRGENVPEGRWSEFEAIALNEITLQNSDQDVAQILCFYNDLVYYSKAPFCIFSLPQSVIFREKNYSQLYSKLKNMKI